MTGGVNNGPRVLIEDWLPVTALGIESRRESAPIPGQFPKLKTLHVWFARRPLAASAGAVLGGLMPAWSPDLARALPDIPEVQNEQIYRNWYLHLIGIWGDPVEAKRMARQAKEAGIKLKENPYTYRPAFKNSLDEQSIAKLHRVLKHTWGALPTVADVTAGGGSIPWTALRFALPTYANDLNSVAAAVLLAGLATPAQFGPALADDLRKWGGLLVERCEKRLGPFFPSRVDETITNYLYAHAIRCPRTGGLVPLVPDWWLRKGDKAAAVRMITHQGAEMLSEPLFEVLHGDTIDAHRASRGTFSGGKAISPYDDLIIDGDYIKSEAKAGRMVTVPYAVVVRNRQTRTFRAPDDRDLKALQDATRFVEQHLDEWISQSIVPADEIDSVSNYERGHRMYGINRWIDFFSPRQLLTHATFVEEFRRLISEVRQALPEDQATAVLTELALMQAKALNYNARQTSWDVGRQKTRSVFEKHNFAFKWTFVEFPGPGELLPWALDQLIDAYEEIARLLDETGRPALSSTPIPRQVTIRHGHAAQLSDLDDGSVHYICMDPPYYANVMYAELANFFYVWEQATLGSVLPDLFAAAACDIDNEAVTNVARFAQMGRRKQELADLDYEAKMADIFMECRRVLRDNGVLTVMFTNKEARAWDALGMALIQAGFIVETSWPVETESETSSHQANKNAAESTILLVCRKRTISVDWKIFLEDLEAQIRDTARSAYRRFSDDGIDGVDLLLATYGPTLSVISQNWPVFSSSADESGRSHLLRPEEALHVAREEIVRIQRRRLVGREIQIDDLTDFVLLAWSTFKAVEFPYDAARRLAFAIGGMDIDALTRDRIVEKKTGTVRLLSPKERLRRGNDDLSGVRIDADRFDVAIDAVHTALYIAAVDGMGQAKALIDRLGLATDQRFIATVQGLINAIPRTRIKGEWVVPEAGLLDTLAVAYLPEVVVPSEEPSVLRVEAPTLFDT